MTGESTTLLSVRADAHLEVAPDEAALDCTIGALDEDKAAALRVLARRVDAATGALRDLGGVVRGAGDQRRALAWLVRAMRTEPEQRYDPKRREYLLTGKVSARAALVVVVRDFGLLNRVGAALAGHQHLHVQYVGWLVDHDNPGWQQVRAAAVDAALVKARDYAAALGGALQRIDHVADVGLLGDRGGEFGHAPRAAADLAMAAPPGSGDEEDGPSLDPVPQELHASIEARFTATVKPLS
jgi:uncharacterized protein YggE